MECERQYYGIGRQGVRELRWHAPLTSASIRPRRGMERRARSTTNEDGVPKKKIQTRERRIMGTEGGQL
jgi:hypothetical protein